MATRLSIINSALIATGNHTVAEGDGSAEWTAASDAYDRAIAWLAEIHPWTFATKQSGALAAAADVSQRYTAAYALPSDLVQLRAVFVNGLPTLDFEIIGNTLAMNGTTAPTIHYTAAPPIGTWSPLFIEAVTMAVQGYVALSLNEDEDAFERLMARARMTAAEAARKRDEQQPARSPFLSRIAARRRAGYSRRWP